MFQAPAAVEVSNPVTCIAYTSPTKVKLMAAVGNKLVLVLFKSQFLSPISHPPSACAQAPMVVIVLHSGAALAPPATSASAHPAMAAASTLRIVFIFSTSCLVETKSPCGTQQSSNCAVDRIYR